ncbi:MAG: UbiX family flavin prenyltransferase [Thermoplasmata archaeon]
MKIVVCITGASGAVYGVRLIETLHHLGQETYLILSEHGAEVVAHETGIDTENLAVLTQRCYKNTDMNADIASGSVKYDACVIVPCSMNTLAKIASGISDNLITRVASVCLKERRKLIVVPRETPLSKIHIEGMLRVVDAGGVVLPAMPGFYMKPKNIEELIDFIVARVLDALGVEHTLTKRWQRYDGI